MIKGGREAALKVIASFRKNGAWSEQTLDSIIKRENLDRREAALASAICYGVLQNLYLCDHYIKSYSNIALSKIEPMVFDILRISVYQLLKMDRIPVHAVVNEAAELTKKYSHAKSAGFVNAILRRIAGNKEFPEMKEASGIEVLSVKYSHPLWLVEEFVRLLGMDNAKKLLEKNNEAVPVSIQVNTLKTDVKSVKHCFDELQIEYIETEEEGGFRLVKPGRLDDMKLFHDGCIYVQDEAARLAASVLDIKPGQFIIDTCSAPGGKSFAAAIKMGNKGKILSCDVHEKKLHLVDSGAKRLGIDIIETMKADASKQNDSLIEQADAVITDVPCSGFGVIRKKPEIRYKKVDEIARLPEIQLSILKNASKYVKSGGQLLYSTCTVLENENETVIKSFLKENGNFVLEPFKLPIGNGRAENGMITLWPHIHGTDGFFICKMRKV